MTAHFTMLLRDVMAKHDIGLMTYPIFDEGHRPILNNKIVEHYRFREIGVETVDMFVFMLNRTMNEIMPYYNQIYETTRLKFDPLTTIDMRTLSETENTAKTNTVSNSGNETSTDSSQRSVNSDTPQTQLSGNGDYATSLADVSGLTKATGTASDQTRGEQQGSDRGSSATMGRTGAVGALLSDYRSAILNVDMLVVGELDVLFMGLWNSGDIYPQTQYVNPYYFGLY